MSGQAHSTGSGQGPAGEVLLKVEGLRLRLGEAQVLDGVSFAVVDRVRADATTGQVVALLGPSGVGKTRLLRIIAGLDAPDGGTVRGPKDVELQPGTVGVVFQNYPLLRHRTVLGNLETAGVIKGLSGPAASERARELLRRFGLLERAELYPAQLSGGQRQRAAIAQQLVRHTSLLLLDEPFSGLDPATMEEVLGMISEVAHMDELNTIMLVTHDIRAAMRISDTIYMLGRDRDEQGKITSGARIQGVYDLVARGLAWHADVADLPDFAPLEREIRGRFRAL